MKKLFLILGLTIFSTTLFQAQNGASFTYSIKATDGTTGSISGFYSGENSRSELHVTHPRFGGFDEVKLILKDRPHVVVLLDDKNKTYIRRKMKETPDTTSLTEYTVKILGKEKVGKYNCTHSMVSVDGETTEYWTTRDIPDFERCSRVYRLGDKRGKENQSEVLKKAGINGFVVKAYSKMVDGNESNLLLESFESGPVNADKFKIPDGYTDRTKNEDSAPEQKKLKDMTPEEREKFIENLNKQRDGGH